MPRPAPTPPSLALQIARSVDASPALLPVLPELLRDLPALGSEPHRVVDLLRRADIGPRSHILDLACGKGVVSIAASRDLGCTALGVDAFAPFIAEARALARAANLSHLCTFRVGDAARTPRTPPRARPPAPPPAFDAALMIGLWGFERAAPRLRALVRPGGFYVIDDAVRLRPAPAGSRSPTADFPTRADARACFAALGDELLAERIAPLPRVRAMNRAILAALRTRAAALETTHPRLRRSLRAFITRQTSASRTLQSDLRPVLWLVRRGTA